MKRVLSVRVPAFLLICVMLLGSAVFAEEACAHANTLTSNDYEYVYERVDAKEHRLITTTWEYVRCAACQEQLAKTLVDSVTGNQPHVFSNGYCACGETEACAHAETNSSTFHKVAEMVFSDITAQTHTFTAPLWETVVCETCSAELSSRIVKESDVQVVPHNFQSGNVCGSCGYDRAAATEAPATEAPTEAPADTPTEAPATEAPTEAPAETPTEAPATEAPTEAPTEVPTEAPTEAPTDAPATEAPTAAPTEAPAEKPTEAPAEKPTEQPTEAPTEKPTEKPTEAPVEKPTEKPTEAPVEKPTEKPTETPAAKPTEKPAGEPTVKPTEEPTAAPTPDLTAEPAVEPAPTPVPVPETVVEMLSLLEFAEVAEEERMRGMLADGETVLLDNLNALLTGFEERGEEVQVRIVDKLEIFTEEEQEAFDALNIWDRMMIYMAILEMDVHAPGMEKWTPEGMMLFADIDFRLSEMSEEEEEDLRTALLSFFPEEPVVVDDAEYASFVIEFEITEGEESSIERCVFYEKEGEWYLLGMYTAEPLA